MASRRSMASSRSSGTLSNSMSHHRFRRSGVNSQAVSNTTPDEQPFSVFKGDLSQDSPPFTLPNFFPAPNNNSRDSFASASSDEQSNHAPKPSRRGKGRKKQQPNVIITHPPPETKEPPPSNRESKKVSSSSLSVTMLDTKPRKSERKRSNVKPAAPTVSYEVEYPDDEEAAMTTVDAMAVARFENEEVINVFGSERDVVEFPDEEENTSCTQVEIW